MWKIGLQNVPIFIFWKTRRKMNPILIIFWRTISWEKSTSPEQCHRTTLCNAKVALYTGTHHELSIVHITSILQLKHEALIWQKRFIYHNQTSLRHLSRNKLNKEYFSYMNKICRSVYYSSSSNSSSNHLRRRAKRFFEIFVDDSIRSDCSTPTTESTILLHLHQLCK